MKTCIPTKPHLSLALAANLEAQDPKPKSGAKNGPLHPSADRDTSAAGPKGKFLPWAWSSRDADFPSGSGIHQVGWVFEG